VFSPAALPVFAILGGMMGCDGSSASPGDLASIARRLEPASTAAHAAPESMDPFGALGLDGGSLEVRIDPPAPAGDLKAEIARFTTLDACVDGLARVDPVAGDALEAIGYDTFLRDACRVIDATKANDPSRCAAIEASSLEARCRATVAEVSGVPDVCPWESPSRRARGRDAKCLAIASREPRLCAGVTDPLDHATCDATLGRDRRPCAKLRRPGEQARCTRDAERWMGLVEPPPDGAKTVASADTQPFVVAGNLHVEAAPTLEAPNPTGPVTAPIDVDLAPDLMRGVTVVVQRDGARIAVGPLAENGLDFVAPSPHTRASLALEIFVPGPSPAKAPSRGRGDGGPGASNARIERVELLLPGRSPLSMPGAQSTLVAAVKGALAARGGPIEIELHGDLAASGVRWRVRASATTFVRDVVTSSDLYGGSLSPRSVPMLGDDAGMR
jgi:hypothetical protein